MSAGAVHFVVPAVEEVQSARRDACRLLYLWCTENQLMCSENRKIFLSWGCQIRFASHEIQAEAKL